MPAEKRKIEYGIEHAYYAPISSTGTEFEAPIEMLGACGFTMESEVEDSVKRADNRVHIVIPGEEVTTGELRMAQLGKEFMQYAHGKKLMANGMLVNTGTRKPFALMFKGKEYIEGGITNDVIVIVYNCLSAPPSMEKNTTDGAIEGEELVSALSISPSSLALDDEGKAAGYAVIYQETTTQGFFTNYGTAIYLPTDVAPAPAMGSHAKKE